MTGSEVNVGNLVFAHKLSLFVQKLNAEGLKCDIFMLHDSFQINTTAECEKEVMARFEEWAVNNYADLIRR